MRCRVCGQRKGKRECPAKGGLICAQCCGEKRVVGIACPADCQHLKTGQSYHRFKHYIALLESQTSAARRRALYETFTEWGGLIEGVEETIVGFAADLRSLRDRDVLEAVETLRKTMETERKGVIFEHRSANPIVQSLAREIGAHLEEVREKPPEGLPPPRLEDWIECLKAVEAGLRFYEQSGEGSGWLRFTAVNHPEAAARRGGGGGLIIP